jgi:5-hydroxyisourate hydrolase
MSAITTHVLDTALGRPASGVPVELSELDAAGAFTRMASGITDGDGRVRDLLPATTSLPAGTYRLRFETAAYFARHNVAGFYPEVLVVFRVRDPGGHYHVPLLLSPYGYSTYRGS